MPGRRHRRRATGAALVLVALGVLLWHTDAPPEAGAGDRAGPRRVVGVATRDLEPGAVLGSDDVAWRALPDEAVPPWALTDDQAVHGRVVTAAIDGGVVVSRRRLAPDGAVGAAALVPAGSVALAIPSDEHTPPLQRGQRVDVLTTAPAATAATAQADRADDPLGAGDGSVRGETATRVVRGGLVVDVLDDRVLVAVSSDDAPAAATAVLDGAVVLTLTGAGG